MRERTVWWAASPTDMTECRCRNARWASDVLVAIDVTICARGAPMPLRSARDRVNALERCARVSWSLLVQ